MAGFRRCLFRRPRGAAPHVPRRVVPEYRAELKRVKALRADAHHAQAASIDELEELSAKY